MRTYRRRYILFRINMDGPPLDSKQLAAAIRKTVLSIWGEIVVADSKIYLHSFDKETGLGILQINSRFVEHVIAASALINSIGQTEISFDPKRISGTLKSLNRKLNRLDAERDLSHRIFENKTS